jgi:xylan 1,4-beta-xylosidase
VAKPILNLFRMTGLMSGDRIQAASDGAPGVDVMATRSSRDVAVLAWNYDADDVPAADAAVKVSVGGLPAGRVLVHHYRIDGTHSNAYTAWKQMGSPQSPTSEQYAALERAGQLQELDSPRWMEVRSGKLDLAFALPRQGVSLVRITLP